MKVVPELPIKDWQILNTALVKIEEHFSGYVLAQEVIVLKHQMFLKIFRNYLTMNQIENGIPLEFHGRNVVVKDYSSLLSVLRSLLETFLLYHHIFFSSRDGQEIDFRLDCWVRQGILTRRKLVQNLEGKSITEEERIELEAIEARLPNYPQMAAITGRNLQDFERYGKWIFTKENARLKSIGLDPTYSEMIYSYLSSYAHSESGSLGQIWHMDLEQKTDEMCGLILNHTTLIVYCFLGFFLEDNSFLADKLGHDLVEHIKSWKAAMMKKTSG